MAAASKETTVKSSDELAKDEATVLSAPVLFFTMCLICILAFALRLFAIVEWESVIHEYDPYFNYRTTKYLTWGGFYEFLNWFDNRSWYPLGRVVGGTLYPGLMVSARFIHWLLNALNISINVRNMCVFLAPIFAANTVLATYLLVHESTRQKSTALLASAFIAMVPSYLSRSVGGSYDNEGVAIFALIFTFYLWVKSVNTGSMFWSALCSLAYFYMVTAWGGYIFIINVIPIYVVLMIVIGRYSERLYIAYSVFYTLGSLLAMQVPFVGFNVITQAECAASHGVFLFLQAFALLHTLSKHLSSRSIRWLLAILFLVLTSFVACVLLYLQFIGKVSWTGRSLTLLDPTYAKKYIPIIASVSEHQSSSWSSFFFDLHILVLLSPVGIYFLYENLSDANIFLILYGTISWYFAGVMVRLMLTLAPIACILAAVGMSSVLQFSFSSLSPRRSSQKHYPVVGSLVLIGWMFILCYLYLQHCVFTAAKAYSSPSIIMQSTLPTGGRAIMDDYREAYYWMRHNTDENAKFMSWWDYGYQMAGMGNRTVIVDNNTWNNTHIATVGRAMSSTEANAYPILRSLDVDYVLVVFGGASGYSSDDINKFYWMFKIGGGVFPNEIHEKDYFADGAYRIDEGATDTLKTCVLYKLCYYRFSEKRTHPQAPEGGYDLVRRAVVGVKNVHLRYFEEAFTSENWIVRIYRVKKQEPYLYTSQVEKKHQIWTNSLASSSRRRESDIPHQYAGCAVKESDLGSDREYTGGETASSLRMALAFAKSRGKRFVAIARAGPDGHVFAFNDITDHTISDSDECERHCPDDQSYCGCADSYCRGPPSGGERNNRKWAVYALAPN